MLARIFWMKYRIDNPNILSTNFISGPTKSFSLKLRQYIEMHKNINYFIGIHQNNQSINMDANMSDKYAVLSRYRIETHK